MLGPFVPAPPASPLRSSHTSLLAVPETCQAHSSLGAFARAVPSAWEAVPSGLSMQLTPPARSCLCSTETLSARPTPTALPE